MINDFPPRLFFHILDFFFSCLFRAQDVFRLSFLVGLFSLLGVVLFHFILFLFLCVSGISFVNVFHFSRSSGFSFLYLFIFFFKVYQAFLLSSFRLKTFFSFLSTSFSRCFRLFLFVHYSFTRFYRLLFPVFRCQNFPGDYFRLRDITYCSSLSLSLSKSSRLLFSFRRHFRLTFLVLFVVKVF